MNTRSCVPGLLEHYGSEPSLLYDDVTAAVARPARLTMEVRHAVDLDPAPDDSPAGLKGFVPGACRSVSVMSMTPLPIVQDRTTT